MKKFLIIGNMNAVTCKEIFPLFKENKVWYGVTIHSGELIFGVPNYYTLRATIRGFDICGRCLIGVTGVRWFTNIPHNKLRALELTQSYSLDKYLKYDNSDAIEVGKIKDIPKDYKGIMGVPITIFDYNLNEFEIIGMLSPYLGGKKKYVRVLIRLKR